MENEKVYAMSFAKIYPLLVNKAVRKGWTAEEVNQVITWLTGYRNAPKPNPNRKLIKGMICGVRVEDIEEPLMQEIRYLDKLVDELAKGKAMEKILRG